MSLHCRDYEFDDTQKSKPVFDRESRSLCGQDLRDVMPNLAFWWCPIERITCDHCRTVRESLELLGRWPEDAVMTEVEEKQGGFKYL